MDKRAPEGGTSVRSLLASQTLAGQSFENYVMAFPSEVTMGDYTVMQDVPLGGAGRPWNETARLAREKFERNYPGDATEALAAIDDLEKVNDIRDVARLFAPR